MVIGFFALVILGIYLASNNALPKIPSFASINATSTIAVTAPNGTINVEIADTDDLRARGLSYRESLASDGGMLFVFQISGIYGFWMKDMNFPLDMVWVDANHKVVAIDSDIATSTYPDSIFPPSDISYVIELNAGAARQFGIATGTVLMFDYKSGH